MKLVIAMRHQNIYCHLKTDIRYLKQQFVLWNRGNYKRKSVLFDGSTQIFWPNKLLKLKKLRRHVRNLGEGTSVIELEMCVMVPEQLSKEISIYLRTFSSLINCRNLKKIRRHDRNLGKRHSVIRQFFRYTNVCYDTG